MANMQLVQTKYAEIADLYMLEKKDEMRAKSEKLFGFWTEYFDQIQKCLPKPEEPKKEKKGKGKSAMQAAMMVELAKKQAEKNMKKWEMTWHIKYNWEIICV